MGPLKSGLYGTSFVRFIWDLVSKVYKYLNEGDKQR